MALSLGLLAPACATQVDDGTLMFDDDAPTAGDDLGAPSFDIPTGDHDAGAGLDAGQPGEAGSELDVGASDGGAGNDASTGTDGNGGDDRMASFLDTGADTGVRVDSGPPPSCIATSCGGCTPQAGCGWCGLFGVCVPGSASGPTTGTCPMGWSWLPAECTGSDPCSTSTSCAACSGRVGCGWCGASRQCVTSNAAGTGPASGTCASAWAYTTSACTTAPPDPCASSTTCGSCTDRGTCGWCRSTRRCMTGTGAGADPTYGTCDSWAWTNSQCPAPTDPCRTAGSCTSCVGRSSCGWCEDSDTCHSGTSRGPTDGSCTSSRWEWEGVFGLFCLP